jgi:hypothetical protein
MNALLFKLDVGRAIRQAISKLPYGTVGIGEDCLWQLTTTHLSGSVNGPSGTNAAYIARQVFDDIVRDHPYTNFVHS